MFTKSQFFDHLPPSLANVVCERPLELSCQSLFSAKISSQICTYLQEQIAFLLFYLFGHDLKNKDIFSQPPSKYPVPTVHIATFSKDPTR